jgi:hypothetical protein
MTTPTPSARPWREIAEEVSREQNSAKLAQLVEELNRAMAEEGVGEPPSTPARRNTLSS